jgi:hypothetical protein
MEFVHTNDFSGYLWIEDNSVDTISTCLSATLFDIDTNHYMVLIISRYPGDAFIGTPYYQLNQKSPMYYKLEDKDLFVYSHTIDNEYTLFPQCKYSEKAVLEKEKPLWSEFSGNSTAKMAMRIDIQFAECNTPNITPAFLTPILSHKLLFVKTFLNF